mgnify:CR=1 FL=1
MTLRRNPLAFGLIYMALSIAVEIVLLLVFRLRIPRDNAILASVLLTVSPPAAAWICGYRRPAAFLLAAGGAVLLTLVLVVGFGRLTGISAGLGPPVVLRTLAGLFAALLANRLCACGRGLEGTD